MASRKNYVTQEQFESAMTAIKQEFDLLYEGQQAIFKIVQSIDERLKTVSDHKPRLDRLEKRVTRLETKVGA